MEFDLKNVSENSSQTKAEPVKVLVLGSGPAGLSAALYAARAELCPVVITGMDMGGQAATTFSIENYPGFPEGVGGLQLGELFQKQAERFGARLEFDVVSSVDLSKRPFRVASYNKEYLAETLIVATGASPNHLDVPGETEYTGHGVSYCATCDGWFFKEKRLVVVGGGDSALEEALFLTRYASSVTIIHRRDSLRAGVILQNRAKENPKINFIWDSVVTSVNGNGTVKSVSLKNVKTGDTSELPVEGVFIFIGHTPNTSLFKDQLELDELGYIVTDPLSHTSVPGVFAGGEASDPHFRQVITSAGMGAAAAIEATHFLESSNE
ncbi:MAG: thioredoxin-disulfide reductase [Anaerolineaceae bacterium]|nr:thioredoxin-disulfide reductase [Anaerolineaceae bacterium]